MNGQIFDIINIPYNGIKFFEKINAIQKPPILNFQINGTIFELDDYQIIIGKYVQSKTFKIVMQIKYFPCCMINNENNDQDNDFEHLLPKAFLKVILDEQFNQFQFEKIPKDEFRLFGLDKFSWNYKNTCFQFLFAFLKKSAFQ